MYVTEILTFCLISRHKIYTTMQNIEKKVEKSQSKRSRTLLNVEDYHQEVKGKLQQMIYDYYSTGSDVQLILIDN